MKLVEKIVTCSYNASRASDRIQATDSSANATGVNQNQENTGFLAVTLDGDNEATNPTPRVKLAAAGEAIYSALATINTATQRCGVITKGVVPFKADVSRTSADIPQPSLLASDIGVGVAGSANGKVRRAGYSSQAGVNPGDPRTATYAAGTGRGLTVGRDTGILWVDLSFNNNAI